MKLSLQTSDLDTEIIQKHDQFYTECNTKQIAFLHREGENIWLKAYLQVS